MDLGGAIRNKHKGRAASSMSKKLKKWMNIQYLQYCLQVTWQTSASDTRVVYAPLASQFPAHACTLTSALEHSCKDLRLDGKNAAS